MNEKPTRPFFIPPALDDLDIKPHPFRVLCHLLRLRGKDGKCYAKGTTIASACRMSDDTVWTALKSLEADGIISRFKKFQGCNNFVIHLPITGENGAIDENSITGENGVIDENPITGKTGVIDDHQLPEKTGCQLPEKTGCQLPEKTGQERIQSKESNRKNPSSEVSPEGLQFAQWFKSTLPTSVNLKSDWQESFAKVHDDLLRIEKRSTEEIRQVCQWARTDSFWQSNFMSPAKLRKRNNDGITYFDLFAQKMKPTAGLKAKFAGTPEPSIQMPT